MPLLALAIPQAREVTAEMDLMKVAGVAEWLELRNKKEVQVFLGFANLYWRFIQDFSHHAHPLFDLTGKDVMWSWGPPEQTAFDTLKHAMTSRPVLLFPDDNSPFCIEANSSDFATGAVLSQQSLEDGKWHLVAFYSKSLNAVEWNYKIHDKEMLAIIRSFEEWWHSWRAHGTSLRSGYITRTLNTSRQPRSSIASKLNGPSTLPTLTSPCTTSLARAWGNQTPCPREQTIE
ncbi:hypothetical protein E4T56_gene11428 [Termitomyces sp. T112]|nr:hypothetical protein E4T56_gene11428 [Termitomyces sp. T112]